MNESIKYNIHNIYNDCIAVLGAVIGVAIIPLSSPPCWTKENESVLCASNALLALFLSLAIIFVVPRTIRANLSQNNYVLATGKIYSALRNL